VESNGPRSQNLEAIGDKVSTTGERASDGTAAYGLSPKYVTLLARTANAEIA
jgi:hypothetical protein